MSKVKKISLAGILIAIAVTCSAFYIPIGAAKCFPIQHAVNVIAGVILGPLYAVIMAFVTSLIRVFTGTGSMLAFPGSMIGAFLCGILYKYSKRIIAAYLGEIIGTGILGAIVAYPVAAFILSKKAALFGFVIPFFVSSAGGAAFAVAIVYTLKKTKILENYGFSNINNKEKKHELQNTDGSR